ncbi:MaoC/PaaZ C-terminal domain-containing protein [Rhodoplanes sp. TEM]|uniref:MaoC/PaaZ C-terminal domain-containing protein n=1 Tax=Rhodoplanes tepidamans TaxID=200616 RepID=A0ABT5JFR0_RHOTP|nr:MULTISPECIES: MaoC/PaaZ C-terminal domain-containing protein [Rhodoplanes]MDC7788134.1 MaoC/PaaZ C-terminal domain-containing protein [Rhodoplanes tepidamans]MDC7984577.1 MaoC/PaaZ C-terminal domain-containing protein [Rhodoplanes sp. TEM]MDQ0355176.1 acyl dehydratase [Rhodoplanes tepidamans]
MVVVENKTFDEISVGQSAKLTRTLTVEDIYLFGVLTGDANPTHYDDLGRDSRGQRVRGHGMWGAALVSALLGNELPGPGTVYKKQMIEFAAPVMLGDTLTVTITVVGLDAADRMVTFDCNGINQKGDTAFTGIAVVEAPAEKRREERVAGLYVQF